VNFPFNVKQLLLWYIIVQIQGKKVSIVKYSIFLYTFFFLLPYIPQWNEKDSCSYLAAPNGLWEENVDAPLIRVSITVSTPRGRTGDGQEGDTGFRRQKLRVIRSVNTVNIGYSITVRLLHCLCIKTWVKSILFAFKLLLIHACIRVNRRYLRGHR